MPASAEEMVAGVMPSLAALCLNWASQDSKPLPSLPHWAPAAPGERSRSTRANTAAPGRKTDRLAPDTYELIPDPSLADASEGHVLARPGGRVRAPLHQGYANQFLAGNH